MSYIQNFFTSRDNNANAETYVGQVGRLWWDPDTNKIYYSDGSTPGGIPVTSGGGGATNKIVNGTSYANIADPDGNVEINADGQSWVFDTNGALTLPNATSGETVSTLNGYITVGNLLIGQGGSLFNSNNDTWALYGNLSDPGVSITIPSNADAANAVPLNITSASNVEITSGGTWTFDTVGNITLPSNVASINYANGTPYGGSGTGLPSQAGNAQKFLQTDGTTPSWQYIAGVFGLWIDGGTAFNGGNCLVVDGGGA